MSNSTEPNVLTIADFLWARIAEEEAEAMWTVDEVNAHLVSPGVAFMPPVQHPKGSWNRMRVVAECDARREVVATCLRWDGDRITRESPPASSAFEHILRSLAQPYSDHPDYNAEWGTT